MIIRPIKSTEKDLWLPLWAAYLAFYNQDLPPEITDLTFDRCRDASEPMGLLGAFEDDRLLGFATYLPHRSSWANAGYVYLEDLYVDPTVRNKGVARALISAIHDFAQKGGFERVYWLTDKGNLTAQALYNKIAEKTDFLLYKKALVV